MCKRCNDTGYLPFKKQGKIIPYTFIDCECKKDIPELYQPLSVGDFDFPCSDLWRGYYFGLSGKPDPMNSFTGRIIHEKEVVRELYYKLKPKTQPGFKDITV